MAAAVAVCGGGTGTRCLISYAHTGTRHGDDDDDDDDLFNA